jgi:hypothetical protein
MADHTLGPPVFTTRQREGDAEDSGQVKPERQPPESLGSSAPTSDCPRGHSYDDGDESESDQEPGVIVEGGGKHILALSRLVAWKSAPE